MGNHTGRYIVNSGWLFLLNLQAIHGVTVIHGTGNNHFQLPVIHLSLGGEPSRCDMICT